MSVNKKKAGRKAATKKTETIEKVEKTKEDDDKVLDMLKDLETDTPIAKDKKTVQRDTFIDRGGKTRLRNPSGRGFE